MTFDEMLYLQIQGTAMGAIFVWTSLSMGYHEIKLYAQTVSNCFEQNWKIILEDCFIFLKLSLTKPKELLNALNNINPTIQFTMGTSDTQLPFLDIMINKEGKKVFMYIFQN